ncbi:MULTISPECIES: PD-(D/E)XK motif protein [unclassified Curtobacterium]|uniref:PD-(D/E)XK motif protein n=1 Tax=unclassified Curtobacterium TaxID=257496 RepID=UPI0015E8B08B|nr:MULTISPECIES: PD-(D/E)XK motif protein [unclassified Curtobacterium]
MTTELRSVSTLVRAWAVLVPPRIAELSSFVLDPRAGESAPRAAVDREGRRHLLVPHTDDASILVAEPNSALTTRSRSLAFGSSPLDYVDITCHDSSLRREFDQICADILEAFDEDGASRAAARSAQVIGRWRRLLRTVRSRALSPEQRIGLFAELNVLRALASEGLADANSWTGPEATPHDFEFDLASIEVKGVGADADHIVIHGAEQLDELDGKPLHLVIAEVHEDVGGERLADVLAEAELAVATPSALRAKVNKLGYSSADDETRFSLGQVFMVLVTPGFPRIIADDLVGGIPDGLSRVSYHLDRAVVIGQMQPAGLDEIKGAIA